MDSEIRERLRPYAWISFVLLVLLTVVERFHLFGATYDRLWPLYLVIAVGVRLAMIVRGGNAREQAGAIARWIFLALLGAFFATITLGLPIWREPGADWPIYIPSVIVLGGLALLVGYGVSMFRRRDLLAWGLGLLLAGGLGVAGVLTGFIQESIPWGSIGDFTSDSRLDFLAVWWPAALIVVGAALIVAAVLDLPGTRRKVLVVAGFLLAVVGAIGLAFTLGWIGSSGPPWWCLMLALLGLGFFAIVRHEDRFGLRRDRSYEDNLSRQDYGAKYFH
jgi:hypothetical protein